MPPNRPLPATLVTVAALILAFSKKKLPFSMVVTRPAVFAELSELRNTEPVPCLRRVVVVGMVTTLPGGIEDKITEPNITGSGGTFPLIADVGVRPAITLNAEIVGMEE